MNRYLFNMFILLFFLTRGVYGQTKLSDLPDEFQKATIYTSPSKSFPVHKAPFTPTYLVIKPKNVAQCKGVMVYTSHFSLDGLGKVKHSLQMDLLKPTGGKLLLRLWEKHNLAVILTNCYRPFRAAGPQVNENQQSPKQAKKLNSIFDELGTIWQNDLAQICEDFEIPHWEKSKWILGTQSNGSKHISYIFPTLPKKMFLGIWMHGSTHYRNPTVASKDQDMLVTVARTDYGYANGLDFYARAQGMGYSNLIIRGDWGKHGFTPVTSRFALKFYDWILAGKPVEEDIFYADAVNLEVFRSDKKNWVPELQRVTLRTRELADDYLKLPVDGRVKLVKLAENEEYQWGMSSMVEAQGDWMDTPMPVGAGNLHVVKYKVRKNGSLGNNSGTLIFKDALIKQSKNGDTFLDDLKIVVQLDKKNVGILGFGYKDVEENKNWEEVEVKLWYHEGEKKVALFVNSHFAGTFNAALSFGEHYTYGVGGLAGIPSDVHFSELQMERQKLTSLEDELKFPIHLMSKDEESWDLHWTESELEDENSSRIITSVKIDHTKTGFAGIVLEDAEKSSRIIRLGIAYGPEKSMVQIDVKHTGKLLNSSDPINLPHGQPIRLQVVHKKNGLSIIIGVPGNPRLATKGLKQKMKIGRIGLGVKGNGLVKFQKLKVN